MKPTNDSQCQALTIYYNVFEIETKQNRDKQNETRRVMNK